MTLPDTIKTVPGTPIIWGEAGASGVTHTLSFDAMADGTAKMGAVADLGASWDMEYSVMLVVETGTAPAATGVTVDLYFAVTHSASYYPGGVTGSADVWPGDGNEDEWAKQLEHVMSLVATADGNVTQVQGPRIWRPSGRYVVPVVDNNLGQAIRDQATASNNTSRVILIPLVMTVTD